MGKGDDDDVDERGAIICRPSRDDVSYVKCDSRGPFVIPRPPVDSASSSSASPPPPSRAPTEDPTAFARRVNRSLNLNLGLSVLNLRNGSVVTRALVRFCRLLNTLIDLVEDYGVVVWLAIPLRARHLLTMVSWRVWYALHRRFLGRRTGIHRDASPEYHAYTTIGWWGNLFPMSLKRVRLALNQVMVIHPPTYPAAAAVREEFRDDDDDDPGRRVGLYLRLRGRDAPADRAVFWIYGGAYLGGDCEGQLGLAQDFADRCGADLFVAHYRLLPEHEFEDALHDVVRAYDHFRTAHSYYEPERTQIVGVSSGGGLAVRLLQRLAADSDASTTTKSPAGAVLMCPFVDYTEPKGSFAEYDQHDLIVNASVTGLGVPFLKQKLGSDENRVRASPVHRSCAGLPPLCVVVSQHECMYDQIVALVDRARADGVDCTLGVWKYMCHVFPMLSPFVPEGRQATDFMINWMRSNVK